VTRTIFDSTVGYPSDSLASCWYCWSNTNTWAWRNCTTPITNAQL